MNKEEGFTKEVLYYKNGNKCREYNYMNNLKHGFVYEFFDTGALMAKIPYQHGKRHGLQCEW